MIIISQSYSPLSVVTNFNFCLNNKPVQNRPTVLWLEIPEKIGAETKLDVIFAPGRADEKVDRYTYNVGTRLTLDRARGAVIRLGRAFRRSARRRGVAARRLSAPRSHRRHGGYHRRRRVITLRSERGWAPRAGQ